MTGPGYVLLSGQFGVSVDEVASSFGAILLGLACFMSVDFSMKASSCSNLHQAIPGFTCCEIRSQNRLSRFSDSGKDRRLVSFSRRYLITSIEDVHLVYLVCRKPKFGFNSSVESISRFRDVSSAKVVVPCHSCCLPN